MQELAVMGFIEPLKRLPRLIKLRRTIINYCIDNEVDLFIGIDAPDFNLGLEKKLHALGITTVHYVSPSVWAWRKGRIKVIKQAVDLMLTLFPFEADFYKQHNVPVCFTGHSAADTIPIACNFNKSTNNNLIALLPGSRDGELRYHAKLYLQTAHYCWQQNNNLEFVIPVVSERHKHYILQELKNLAYKFPVHILVGKVREILPTIAIALVTSGTATLDVMLHNKPMVVAYKLHNLSYWVLRLLVKLKYIALPNLLAGSAIVPEFIQHDATVKNLGNGLLKLLDDPTVQKSEFIKLHKILRNNAADVAAGAINKLIESKKLC